MKKLKHAIICNIHSTTYISYLILKVSKAILVLVGLLHALSDLIVPS